MRTGTASAAVPERELVDHVRRAGARRRFGALVAGAVGFSSIEREPATGLGHGKQATGTSEVARLLEGTVETNGVLGQADAPVTLTEFVDLQSPASADYATKVLPTLVKRHVRTGQLRVERRVVAIFDGSESATAWAAAAAGRGRLFAFSETFLRNQGHDDDGYLTPEFLAGVAAAAGLGPQRLDLLAAGYRARARVAADARDFKREGFEAAPTLTVRATDGGRSRRLTELSVEGVSRQVQALRGQR